MKKILFITLALLCASIAFGQDKKVAVLEPLIGGGVVTQIEKDIILAALEDAITETPGYRAFTRVDVNQITKELSFQENGMVNDAQRQKIGQLSGASLICISQLTAGTNILIKCSLVDVETGEIVNVASQLMKKDETAIYEDCRQLAAILFGGRNPTNSAVYNPDGIELVYVEGGTSGIQVIQDFYIGKYEITQAQYQDIMGVNPSHFKGSDSPVDNISWYDAQEFITKLKARTGRNYRLPTEAEWVYAAREGKNNSKYRYSGGEDIDAVAWYKGNSGKTTHPVGQKLPNALGLYDTTGNVAEWCQDWYSSSCVYRGGSWNHNEQGCRVAYRFSYSPGARDNNLGFRVAYSLK
jgi:hypothetical protein